MIEIRSWIGSTDEISNLGFLSFVVTWSGIDIGELLLTSLSISDKTAFLPMNWTFFKGKECSISVFGCQIGLKLKKHRGFSTWEFEELAISKFKKLMKQFGFQGNSKNRKTGQVMKHLSFLFPCFSRTVYNFESMKRFGELNSLLLKVFVM